MQHTEAEDRVRAAMLTVSPGTEPDVVERIEGHYKNSIIVLETHLKKAAEIRRCWDQVRGHLPETILGELDSRTDENQVFHLRFAKQAAYLGEVKIWTGDGDSIQFRGRVVTYPHNREAALEKLRDGISQIQ